MSHWAVEGHSFAKVDKLVHFFLDAQGHLNLILELGAERIKASGDVCSQHFDVRGHVGKVFVVFVENVEALQMSQRGRVTYVFLLLINGHLAESSENQGQPNVIVWHLRHHVQPVVQLRDVHLGNKLLRFRLSRF